MAAVVMNRVSGERRKNQHIFICICDPAETGGVNVRFSREGDIMADERCEH